MTLVEYRDNFFRAISLVYKVGTEAKRGLLDYHLQNENTSLTDFINTNQHAIFHLYTCSKCCQCGNSNPKNGQTVIKRAQMEQIFNSKSKIPSHKSQANKEPFCCCQARFCLTLRDLDISILHTILINICTDLFWENILQSKTKNIEPFFTNHMHRLYHFWKPKQCCRDGCGVVNGVRLRINETQWLSVYDKTGNQTCQSPNPDICSYQCKSNLNTSHIDKSLEKIIFRHFSKLHAAVENLLQHRNDIAHSGSDELSQSEFDVIWKDSESAILDIAGFLGRESSYSNEIETIKFKCLDTTILKQLQVTVINYRLSQNDIQQELAELRRENYEERRENQEQRRVNHEQREEIKRLNDTTERCERKLDQLAWLFSSDGHNLKVEQEIRVKKKPHISKGEQRPRRPMKSPFKAFLDKILRRKKTEEENPDEFYDDPDDLLSCGGCKKDIRGGKNIREHRRSCTERKQKRERLSTHNNVILEEQHLPNQIELSTLTEYDKDNDVLDDDKIEILGAYRSSLLIWAKISKACCDKKDSLTETIRGLFQRVLNKQRFEYNVKMDFVVTAHFIESDDDFESDDLEGDLYICGNCKKPFTRYKRYRAHKKQPCEKNKYGPLDGLELEKPFYEAIDSITSDACINEQKDVMDMNVTSDVDVMDMYATSDVGTDLDDDTIALDSRKTFVESSSGYETDIEGRSNIAICSHKKKTPTKLRPFLTYPLPYRFESSETSGYETNIESDIFHTSDVNSRRNIQQQKKTNSQTFRKTSYKAKISIEETDSSDEIDEERCSSTTVNYFEQSKEQTNTFDNRDFFNSHAIQKGLQLSKRCVTQLTEDLERALNKKYPDFYPAFVNSEELCKLLRQQPEIYKRGQLQIDSAHGAFCKVKNATDGIDVIYISGRSKCGKAYTDDEVVVKILINAADQHRKKQNRHEKANKVYGQVVGVLERSRKCNIKHPVFVCELDNFDNNQVKPICKTIPKLQLIWPAEYKGYFTVDLYDYNADRKDLVNRNKPIKITPDRRRKYLFYVVFLSWTTIYPAGVVIDIHKSTKRFLSGLNILELQYEVPTMYKQETVLRLQNSLDANFQDHKEGRADFTESLKVFTIDPKSSVVLDDALSIDRLPNGRIRVGVHISDVTAYIEKDDSVDKEAQERGTTFFGGSFGHPHHMLPNPLSTDTCSLLPGKTRLTLTIFLFFSKTLEYQGHSFAKSYIKSKERLTYQQVQGVIEEKEDFEWKDDILLLFQIASAVRQKRLKNAMFGIPVEHDFMGDIETETDCFEAYFTVAEFMILVNDAVARVLMASVKFKHCVPLRCHDAPDPFKVQKWLQSYPKLIDQIVQLQNVKPLPSEEISLTNLTKEGQNIRFNNICFLQKWIWKDFCNCMEKEEYEKARRILCKDEMHPFQAVALDEWFSLQENAEYRCSGDVDKIKGSHFGLNKYPYVHFTSPIRRYIDIVVHRLLKAVLSNRDPPYSQKDISSICRHMNEVSLKARQFETKCKSLMLAHEVENKPRIIFGFVKEFTDQDICIVLPGLKFLNEETRTLALEHLDLSRQPDFKKDLETINYAADRDVLILNWERRIYSKNKWRPIPKNKGKGYQHAAANEAQRLHPHQRTDVQLLKRWYDYLKTVFTFQNLSSKLFSKKMDDTNLVRYAPTQMNTEYDVNCELEKESKTPRQFCQHDDNEDASSEQDEFETETNQSEKDTNNGNKIITKQTCNFSMSFSRGQVVALQIASTIQKGILSPYIQMLEITKNITFCTEHMRDPVSCLEKYSVIRPKAIYATPEEYQEIWLPIIAMESVMDSVHSDTILINEVKLKFTGKSGYFVLSNEFCTERNIVLGNVKTDIREDKDIIDIGGDGEQSPNVYVPRCDYLCIRCPILKQQFDTYAGGHDQVGWQKWRPDGYYIWSAHANITNVACSKKSGNTAVHFEIKSNSNSPPNELLVANCQMYSSVEILQKSALDLRIETALRFLHKATLLARSIAQRLDIPEFDKDHSHLRHITGSDVSIGLPKNNKKQKEAILMAMRKRFSLIHGPPGTGKTNTAIKLIYLFNEINRKIQMETEEKKHILFCGPSNKSVDLVALRLLNRAIPTSPKIARLYGGSLANCDFPIPGKFFSNKKGSSGDKPEQKLKPVSIHWLIRQNGKPYAREIKEFETNFKDKGNLRIEDITEYSELISRATQDELENYEVIFCTTAMATNSNILKKLENKIFQVIIDECGMCTEPECLATIIATKAVQVVLIGDHKQLKPVVQSQQAQLLGLDISLFERYRNLKSRKNNKNIVQLKTQYRMHHSICEFPSKAFYKDDLHTGKSESYVENPPLQIWGQKNDRRHVFCHVEGTEEVLTVSTGEGNIMSRSNQEEIAQVVKIYKHLDQKEGVFGVKGNQNVCTVNIMSQYNAQCKAITKALENEGYHNVNVNTVNSSQGGEWDYVIFSLVRSLPQTRIERYPTLGWCKRNLGFIIDENQMNVALTRAKKGLFIIGNQNLLRSNVKWEELITFYATNGCFYDANEFPKSIPKPKKKKDKEYDEAGFQIVK